ncbi:MAG TPA: hypothetical protein VF230_14085 [Acidimicrobiales bacterium]
MADDQVVSDAVANRELGLRTRFAYGMLVATEALHAARSEGGERGVTRASLDRELRWRREANLFARMRRRARTLVHCLSF